MSVQPLKGTLTCCFAVLACFYTRFHNLVLCAALTISLCDFSFLYSGQVFLILPQPHVAAESYLGFSWRPTPEKSVVLNQILSVSAVLSLCRRVLFSPEF